MVKPFIFDNVFYYLQLVNCRILFFAGISVNLSRSLLAVGKVFYFTTVTSVVVNYHNYVTKSTKSRPGQYGKKHVDKMKILLTIIKKEALLYLRKTCSREFIS